MHEIFPPIFFEPFPNFVFVHVYIRAYQPDTFKGFFKIVFGRKILRLLALWRLPPGIKEKFPK